MASNPLLTLGTIFVNNENQGTTIVVSDQLCNAKRYCRRSYKWKTQVPVLVLEQAYLFSLLGCFSKHYTYDKYTTWDTLRTLWVFILSVIKFRNPYDTQTFYIQDGSKIVKCCLKIYFMNVDYYFWDIYMIHQSGRHVPSTVNLLHKL